MPVFGAIAQLDLSLEKIEKGMIMTIGLRTGLAVVCVWMVALGATAAFAAEPQLKLTVLDPPLGRVAAEKAVLKIRLSNPTGEVVQCRPLEPGFLGLVIEAHGAPPFRLPKLDPPEKRKDVTVPAGGVVNRDVDLSKWFPQGIPPGVYDLHFTYAPLRDKPDVAVVSNRLRLTVDAEGFRHHGGWNLIMDEVSLAMPLVLNMGLMNRTKQAKIIPDFYAPTAPLDIVVEKRNGQDDWKEVWKSEGGKTLDEEPARRVENPPKGYAVLHSAQLSRAHVSLTRLGFRPDRGIYRARMTWRVKPGLSLVRVTGPLLIDDRILRAWGRDRIDAIMKGLSRESVARIIATGEESQVVACMQIVGIVGKHLGKRKPQFAVLLKGVAENALKANTIVTALAVLDSIDPQTARVVIAAVLKRDRVGAGAKAFARALLPDPPRKAPPQKSDGGEAEK